MIAIALAAVGVAALAAWLGTSWLSTYRQAQAFSDRVGALRAQVTARDWQAATTAVPEALAAAEELQAATGGVPWRVLSALPGIGATAGAASDLATAATGLLAAARPLLPYAERVVDDGLRRADGSVDLDLLAEVSPRLDDLAAAAGQAAGRLARIDPDAVRPELAVPLRQATIELGDAALVLADAADVARRLPPMLGADGTRDWLVLLQNPAESRGSGGFPGAYVTLSAQDGRLVPTSAGKVGDLNATPIPLDGVPADSRVMWGDYLTQWNTFNLSAHFPLVGRLAANGMGAYGQPVDGVVAVDPRVIAAMLEVTGPVTALGWTLTGDNAEAFFTVDSYARIPDQAQRNAVTIALVQAALAAFLGGAWSPLDLAEAMGAPIGEGRLRVWSSAPGEQAWLEGLPVGGSVPDSPGPVVAVAFDNASGSKLDAFVATRVEYRPGTCPTRDVQSSTLSVTLRNDAPQDLPVASGNYGRADAEGGPEGSTRLLVYVYAPVGAGFLASAIDGAQAPLYAGTERDRPVWWTYVTLERGQEATIDVRFTEPDVEGVPARVLRQGMVIDEQVTVVADPLC